MLERMPCVSAGRGLGISIDLFRADRRGHHPSATRDRPSSRAAIRLDIVRRVQARMSGRHRPTAPASLPAEESGRARCISIAVGTRADACVCAYDAIRLDVFAWGVFAALRVATLRPPERWAENSCVVARDTGS